MLVRLVGLVWIWIVVSGWLDEICIMVPSAWLLSIYNTCGVCEGKEERAEAWLQTGLSCAIVRVL